MTKKTFGVKLDGTEYFDRVGIYGVGFNKKGEVAVVKAPFFNDALAYFLLGGGIEDGENHETCLKRECLEEAGLDITPKKCVCKGDYYFFNEKRQKHFHFIGYFYLMDVNGVVSKPIELDHELLWLSVEEARQKLTLPHQAWALEESYREYKNT